MKNLRIFMTSRSVNMKKIVLLSLCFLFIDVTFGQMSPDHVRAIDSLFSKYDDVHSTGISVMIIEKGKIVYDRAYGLAEIETRTKAAANTNYRIASITKSFTAMAIMMLRDQDKLQLEDPLTKFFPSVPEFGKQITIRQMLNHTSGLMGYADFVSKGTVAPLQDTDVLRIVEKQDSTQFKPGSRFSYSNTAYVLLGLIVEKVSGLSFTDFVKQRIFRPLKMDASTLNSITGTIKKRAYGYNLIDGKLLKQDQSIYSYLLGDGGIYSSVKDFYKWDQALYSGKLVKQSTLQEIFSPSSREAPNLDYGFGWYIENKNGTRRISHSGGTTGFSSYYVRYPEIKFSVVIFANQDDGLALGPYVDAIERIYFNNK